MINLKELAQSIFSLPGALLRDQDYIYYYSNLQEVELNKAQVFAFDYFGGGHGFKGSIQKFHVSELKNPFWDISDQVNFISPDHSLFIKTVLGLKSRIKDKEFDKAVPFFFSQGKNQINSEILWKIWSNLLHAPLTLNSYAIWTDKWGMMGASPETLFEKQNKSISTMALAGTFARNQISSDQIESLDHLLSDPKERFEHEIVVRDLVQVLQQWGQVTIGSIEPLVLPHLIHLKTDLLVSVTAAMPSAYEIAKTLHPTGALGVFPRSVPYQLLEAYEEKGMRGSFGAPICFNLENGIERCLVGIRSWQWKKSEIYLGAGFGLVAPSDPKKEWLELLAKMNSTLKLGGFASLKTTEFKEPKWEI